MNVKDHLCSPDAPLWNVIEILNLGAPIIAIVVDDDGRLLGCITDGDIRRALLEKKSLDSPAGEIMNPDPKFLFQHERDQAAAIFRDTSIHCIPLLDDDRVVTSILSRMGEGCKEAELVARSNKVCIMAGGKGTRLAPLTKIIPKPLIPIDDKPIIEHIIDKFRGHGFSQFVISLNYKGEMIENYFRDYDKAAIEYVRETEFRGTAGSLQLARELVDETFFVVNCDVMADVNFSGLMDYHKEQDNKATLVGVLRKVNVPYGIIELKNRECESLVEKPSYSFLVNGGIYVLEPEILDLIEGDEFVDMPTLLMRAKDQGLRVGVFPFSSDWADVGTVDEYRKVLDKLYK